MSSKGVVEYQSGTGYWSCTIHKKDDGREEVDPSREESCALFCEPKKEDRPGARTRAIITCELLRCERWTGKKNLLVMRIELMTLGLLDPRSNQLSYTS